MKDTTDIWFGSFLLLQGHQVADYDVIKKGKGRYYFELTEEQWKDLKLAFNTSDISSLKMHHMALKDLVY